MFLIGSVYFVAGSYPACDDDLERQSDTRKHSNHIKGVLNDMEDDLLSSRGTVPAEPTDSDDDQNLSLLHPYIIAEQL